MTAPVIVPTDLLAGPVALFTGAFGSPEPANANALIDTTVWTPAGGTQEGVRQVVNQSYFKMGVDEVPMALDARLTEQTAQIVTALAEHRLDNYRLAWNQARTGTNEVQTLSLGAATAGTFTITFNGQTTSAIAYNATAAVVQAALEALSNVDPGDVTVSGGPLPAQVTLTFGGRYSATDVPQITITPTLTGGTVTVATSTVGAPGNKIGIGANPQLNKSPLFRAVLARGLGPSGLNRLVIMRKVLSTESVENRYQKGGQTYIPITWDAFWVSNSLDAVVIDDTQV
jgi:hypothetical protein